MRGVEKFIYRKSLRRLCASLHLAQKVGTSLGRSEIFQRILPSQASTAMNDALFAVVGKFWIHVERVPWQVGAEFFRRHLLDADPASNTLSWRWVAGLQTRGKIYRVQRDNLQHYLSIVIGFTWPGPTGEKR